MLTHEENELLCRIGPTAPMGQMMRRYWIPAALSSDLVVGGAPKRVRLLGENLVAFRDSLGRVGLLDENCPHRGASLVLARNEDCVLRCLYHGWAIDVNGTILATPAEPEESSFGTRVRALVYPVRESGGVVWAYMGPPGEEPPLPDFAWTQVPESHRWVSKVRVECNWAQCVEGVIDSSHVNYLHSNLFTPTAKLAESVMTDTGKVDRPSSDGRPRIEAQNTAYGFRYAAIRKPLLDADRNHYVRVTLFVAPFFTLIAAPAGMIAMQIFVPIDDEHTMFFYCKAVYDEPADPAAFREQQDVRSGMRPGVDFDAEFRKFRTRENVWLQDRDEIARGESPSGIFGVAMQDFCITESMGPIFDRSKEHLGASDVAVIRMRRLMLDSVKGFIERGEPPLGLREPVPYAKLRSEEKILPLETPWQVVGAFAGETPEPTLT